jgi:polyferredoxin
MALIFLIVLIGGWRYHLLGYFIPLCMVLGIAIGLFRGRMWCDWVCPRGSFYDVVMKPVSPKGKIPAIFKQASFRIIFLSILMLIMINQLLRRWPDLDRIGMLFVALLTVTTSLGVLLALLFHQRTWCYLCPIGTIANLAGRKRHPLMIDSKACTDCSLCTNICPMQLSPSSFKGKDREVVRGWDCLKCDLCVTACPKGALGRERAPTQ